MAANTAGHGEGLICRFLRKKENDQSNKALYQIRTSDIFISEIPKTAK